MRTLTTDGTLLSNPLKWLVVDVIIVWYNGTFWALQNGIKILGKNLSPLWFHMGCNPKYTCIITILTRITCQRNLTLSSARPLPIWIDSSYKALQNDIKLSWKKLAIRKSLGDTTIKHDFKPFYRFVRNFLLGNLWLLLKAIWYSESPWETE